jgi:ADP-ribosylglycohydrolase
MEEYSMKRDKVSGALFGMAIGDSIGAVTEFMDMERISKRFPPGLSPEPIGYPAMVTDDSQMALAVGEALVETPHLKPDEFGSFLREKFVTWLNSPDNNRAPGNTCLRSCRRLETEMPWYEATVMGSKGCGANMRVQSVGLIDVSTELRAKIAQLQAAYTHAHPTALAAADLTAFVISMLARSTTPDTIIQECWNYGLSQRDVYHEDWLGDGLWQQYPRFGASTPQVNYISRGWDEVLGVLERIERAPRQLDRLDDPCQHTGAGWVADEAFATALYCFLLFPDDATAVVQRAAFTSGDSDSIGAIAGAFAGVYLGINAWSHDWVERIEYRDRIEALVDGLQNVQVGYATLD